MSPIYNLRGIEVRTRPDNPAPGSGNCSRCAFNDDCLGPLEEKEAGVVNCLVGKHHYVEVPPDELRDLGH